MVINGDVMDIQTLCNVTPTCVYVSSINVLLISSRFTNVTLLGIGVVISCYVAMLLLGFGVTYVFYIS